jgi:putative methionine-R-sulfoxide reductase with GAF domain
MDATQPGYFQKRTGQDAETTRSAAEFLRSNGEIPPLNAVWPELQSETTASEPLGLLGRAQLQQEFTQAKARAQKLKVLHDIGCAITSALDLEEVLTRIVEAAVYVTGAEEGSLLLLDDETKELQLRAQKGLGDTHARGFRIRTDDSIAGEVVASNRPQRLASAEQGLKVVTGYLVNSILYVPVSIKSRVIGVLVVDNQSPELPFSDDDESLLQVLAGYAAIALENARLREELADRSDAGALGMLGAEAVQIWLKPNPEPQPSQALTPQYLTGVVCPYLGALDELQRVLEGLEGKPYRQMRILAIGHGIPVPITLDGVADAVRILKDMVMPWRQAHATLLAQVVEKEGEAAIETAWVEVLEARARASEAGDDREQALAQAEQQRSEAARKEAEGWPLRTDAQWAILQLASDLLAQVAPDLSEGEWLIRLVRLLPALETIVSSPLALSTAP